MNQSTIVSMAVDPVILDNECRRMQGREESCSSYSNIALASGSPCPQPEPFAPSRRSAAGLARRYCASPCISGYIWWSHDAVRQPAALAAIVAIGGPRWCKRRIRNR